MLGSYLTSGPVAPLNKEYVEIETPLWYVHSSPVIECLTQLLFPSTYLYFETAESATNGSLTIYAGSVPMEELDGFDKRLLNSLKRVAAEGIDMERMLMLINRDERQLRSKLESSKGETFSSVIINDCLYGAEDGSELGPSLQEIVRYAQLRKWTSKDWVNLLQK